MLNRRIQQAGILLPRNSGGTPQCILQHARQEAFPMKRYGFMLEYQIFSNFQEPDNPAWFLVFPNECNVATRYPLI